MYNRKTTWFAALIEAGVNGFKKIPPRTFIGKKRGTISEEGPPDPSSKQAERTASYQSLSNGEPNGSPFLFECLREGPPCYSIRQCESCRVVASVA